MRPNARLASPGSCEADLTALLSLPADRRMFFLCNSRRAYRLVEALAGHAFSLRFSDVAAMLDLARFASEAAEALSPEQTQRTSRELADLRAHARAVLGNALRIAGDFAAAEEALDIARRHLGAGTGRRPDLTALRLEFSASLREGQREFREAHRLLARAFAIRQGLGDRDGTAKVRVKQGIVFGYGGDPECAVAALVEGLELVEKDQDLARAASQSLIWHLIEAYQLDKAQAKLANVRALLALGGDLFQLKVEWLEAKLAASLDPSDLGPTRRRYERTHRAYAERGLLREATLVALDLCMLSPSRRAG
jgi:hypothetical protein